MAPKGIHLSEGERLGAYQIRAHIGRGAMASVYLAAHVETGREAALKVLDAAWATVPEAVSRFRHEVEAIQRAAHPNVVAILEVGLGAKPPYIAMEYVRGRTLRAALTESLLPLGSTLSVGIQLADGLGATHRAGIVHRDLKPENIMVRPDGVVKILDFGLSKCLRRRRPAADASGSLTLPGTILGTVEYMSPEQASGRRADFRADQFSLGAILYEMVTGVVAFRRESLLKTLDAVQNGAPARLDAFRSNVPPDVRAVIERALAKSPEDRFASMEEMKAALAAARRRIESGLIPRAVGLGWERLATAFRAVRSV